MYGSDRFPRKNVQKSKILHTRIARRYVNRQNAVTMCIVAVLMEECCNGKVAGSEDTDDVTPVDGAARMQPTNNEILFGVASTPPWYLVIAYAMQVCVFFMETIVL